MGSDVIIDSFALAGYRSFGKEIQRFEYFSKINLFIGQNNCGKSNVLSFIHNVYPQLCKSSYIKLEPLDAHMLSGAVFVTGKRISLEKQNEEGLERLPELGLRENLLNSVTHQSVYKVFKRKAELDNSSHHVWFYYDYSLKLVEKSLWKEAFDILDDREIYNMWGSLQNKSGGGREEHWYPESLDVLTLKFQSANTKIIPAIRKIGKKGSVSDDFSGEGIIERLVKLQNPDVDNQIDRKKFNDINSFLQNVTDNTSATIEIPHNRETILVHMDEKTLPLESLGTGVHEVIILASAATILENTVICMEEPELHLNPILQKKLVRYLEKATNNQYFITTHSAALMDTPNAEIYHINLESGASKVKRVTSDTHKSEVCADLGYHPSDLLQSNCIIWVEGPSDRIYLNYWINESSQELVEGIHYSIMFYGGSLAAHISGHDIDEAVEEDFISLRRMNRRSVILIDSDRAKKGIHLKPAASRLEKEFNDGTGHAWITGGREVENYLNVDFLKEAIKEIHPFATVASKLGKYDNCLSIKTKSKKDSQASKVKVAKYITENKEVDLTILDLKAQISKLVTFIEESNPKVSAGNDV